MKLVIEDESGTRSIVPLAGEQVTVGRGEEGNALPLPDRDVSRRHARFTLVNGAVFVEDLGSLTGTRVNGERISGRRRLREGDLVEIGGYDLAVVPDGGLAAMAGPGAPPPLPHASRPPTTEAPVAAARPAAPFAPTVQLSAASPPRPRLPAPTHRVTWLLAGLVAALLGLALGYATGALTRPAPRIQAR
jgi:predicted component of type VI protein secretion system